MTLCHTSSLNLSSFEKGVVMVSHKTRNCLVRTVRQDQSLGEIDNLDLSMVKMKLCLPVEKEGKGWTLSQADIAELWYKRFLKLCLLRSEDVVPTKMIDEVWHAHILDTRAYHADCRRIFGRYLHHFPYFGLRSKLDQRNLKKAFEATASLFEEYFGESPILTFQSFHDGGRVASKCGQKGCGTGCSRKNTESVASCNNSGSNSCSRK